MRTHSANVSPLGAALLNVSLMLPMAIGVMLVFPVPAEALPMYGQRSGRTCGNCHISPTYEDPAGWDNPELLKRKCNMSCMTCHVNPTGGGLRNASGRYYGQSTLPMLPLQERSYSDEKREMLPATWISALKNVFRPHNYVYPGGKQRVIPSSSTDVAAGIGQGSGVHTRWLNVAQQPSQQGEYAFWDGRYGDLAADPVLNFGADLRTAYWSGHGNLFPMQADIHGAAHPFEHVTVMGTLAGRGRAGGPVAVLKQEQLPVFARNAFVMAHELPGMSFARAGVFMPSFGTYTDDHTSFIREYFEMDVSTSDDTVLGVEVGTAPNYPYATLSAFQNMRPAYAPSSSPRGYGGALNVGWRDLGFSFGAHGMIKRRPLAARGDLDAAGITWGLNSAYYWDALPITYMGELSYGRVERPLVGGAKTMVASYHEISALIFNGVTMRVKHDWGRRDQELNSASEERWSLSLDLTPIPGATLVVQGRWLRRAGKPDGTMDIFSYLHWWI